MVETLFVRSGPRDSLFGSKVMLEALVVESGRCQLSALIRKPRRKSLAHHPRI